MTHRALIIFCVLGWLAGCSSGPRIKQTPQASKPASAPAARGGGYYLDDGPGDNPPADLLAIPDAIPRAEPLHRYANRPYEALGVQYTPMIEPGHYQMEGVASWYGRRYHGKPTASGETYDMYGMTAAHPTLPIPSYVRVISLNNDKSGGKSVVVRINDRGPFHSDRVIDLSYTAAYKLGVVGNGSGRVRVESLDVKNPDVGNPEAKNLDPQKPATPVAASMPQPGYFVQMGAFGQPGNAEKLLQRARETLGITPELARVVLVGELHRVSLGPFATEGEAIIWVDKSRAALGIEALKTRY